MGVQPHFATAMGSSADRDSASCRGSIRRRRSSRFSIESSSSPFPPCWSDAPRTRPWEASTRTSSTSTPKCGYASQRHSTSAASRFGMRSTGFTLVKPRRAVAPWPRSSSFSSTRCPRRCGAWSPTRITRAPCACCPGHTVLPGSTDHCWADARGGGGSGSTGERGRAALARSREYRWRSGGAEGFLEMSQDRRMPRGRMDVDQYGNSDPAVAEIDARAVAPPPTHVREAPDSEAR